MTKKISNFIKNFRVYVIIVLTMIVIFIVSLLILRNITKDKEDVVPTPSNVVDVTNSTISADEEVEEEIDSLIDSENEDNLPAEPSLPQIEIPEIKP